MTRRRFVIACCCMVLSASALFAQTSKPKPDAITGTWVGQLASKSTPEPMSVTLKLKFDGKSAVTGTIEGFPNPGDVKSGTFDPKTGALKLELGKTSDSTVLLILEGAVANGKAAGKVTGESTGEFSLTKKS
jgi:hypothetical protein